MNCSSFKTDQTQIERFDSKKKFYLYNFKI